MSDTRVSMDKLVALCKTRGFVFPGSDMYGGLANSWDYGPLGVELKKGTDFETFFAKAPKMNRSRHLITGAICGVRVEDIKDPTMQAVRYLDKLVDELAKGRAMEKVLRQ